MEAKEPKKVKLTKEVQEKLKLYTSIKPVDDFDFTPVVFKENFKKELWPVFKCRAVKTTDIMMNSAYSGGGVKLHLFKLGVKSWTNPNNILGADFKPEYIDDNVLTDTAVCLFTAVLISDIALEINSKSTISFDEEISL